jgi:hypothetical protein
MATSQFQNLRAALITLISPIADCVISAYPPYGNEWTREDRVWLAAIRSEQSKLAFGGARAEDLTVTLIIYVPRYGGSGDDLAVVEERAEVILAAIESDIRTDDTIGGSVMNADIDSFESETVMSDTFGPLAVMEVTITAEANL